MNRYFAAGEKPARHRDILQMSEIEGPRDMSTRLDARLLTTALALSRWQPEDLARRSGVPHGVIEAIELKTDTRPHSAGDNDAVVAAFEAAGLEFGEINGTIGVWFRTRRRGEAPASLPLDKLNASNDE